MLSVMGIKHNSISFGRAPRAAESKELTATSAEAKAYLGIKKQVVVLHRSCYPVTSGDLFIGSNMNHAALKLNKHFKMFGYDTIMDGPPGTPSIEDPSPYRTPVFSKSYLNADMKELTTEPYGGILEMSDILSKGSREYEETSDMTDFNRAFKAYDELFEQAYDNLAKKIDTNSKNLKNEFNTFKQKAGSWLETDSIYDILRRKFGNDNWEKWDNSTEDGEIAQHLISYKNDPSHPKHKQASQYMAKLNSENAKELDLYKFKQFIVSKQEKEFSKRHPEKLDMMQDGKILFSSWEEWANQEAFLKDFKVGAPGGGAGFDGRIRNQTWDISILNPKTIFNEDGTLGKGGNLLKQKFSSLLENSQGLRMDHVLGLVDPWIYNKNYIEVIKDANGQIESTNAHGNFLSNMNWDNSFDPKHNYTKILEDIIIPVLNEKGIDVNDVAWESLGDQTQTFKEVYFNRLHLAEMTDVKWQQVEHMPKENWLVVSTHDDEALSKTFSNGYFESKIEDAIKPSYLMGFLYPEKTNEERAKLMQDLSWDRRIRVESKIEEAFTCGKKIIIAAFDALGCDPNKVYNEKGHSNPNNWKLRLPKNYQQEFYNALIRKGKGEEIPRVAINQPGVYLRAIISKIFTDGRPRAQQEAEFNRMKPLVDKLSKYEKILYEPERTTRKVVIDKLKEFNLIRLAKKAAA